MDALLPERFLLFFCFRFVVLLEFFKVRDEFRFACQAHEVVADHLERPFGRLAASPKVD